METFALSVVMDEPMRSGEAPLYSYLEHGTNDIASRRAWQVVLALDLSQECSIVVVAIFFPWPQEVMMKKVFICMVLICAISVPSAFSQFRLELGANAPVAVGYLTGSGTSGDIASTIEQSGIIPIPNLALLLQANLGLIKIGVGVKAQSVIVYIPRLSGRPA